MPAGSTDPVDFLNGIVGQTESTLSGDQRVPVKVILDLLAVVMEMFHRGTGFRLKLDPSIGLRSSRLGQVGPLYTLSLGVEGPPGRLPTAGRGRRGVGQGRGVGQAGQGGGVVSKGWEEQRLRGTVAQWGVVTGGRAN